MKFKAKREIILASQSPRRKELLGKLGLPFRAMASDVDELFEERPESLQQYVLHLATEKAQAVAHKEPAKVVIGADTIVSYNGQVFPKPNDDEEAKQFLRTLSGKTHVVITAVAIVKDGETYTFISETQVTFSELTHDLMNAYIASGDPFDKAGAYGIQSGGALFVKEIQGDYYAVMGLPVAKLAERLQTLDVIEVGRRVNLE